MNAVISMQKVVQLLKSLKNIKSPFSRVLHCNTARLNSDPINERDSWLCSCRAKSICSGIVWVINPDQNPIRSIGKYTYCMFWHWVWQLDSTAQHILQIAKILRCSSRQGREPIEMSLMDPFVHFNDQNSPSLARSQVEIIHAQNLECKRTSICSNIWTQSARKLSRVASYSAARKGGLGPSCILERR